MPNYYVVLIKRLKNIMWAQLNRFEAKFVFTIFSLWEF